MLTEGIQNLDEALRFEILQQVRAFDAFTPDNDPYGEHDFGVLRLQGLRVFWKFDYFDRSPDESGAMADDPAGVARVLTIMLADEY